MASGRRLSGPSNTHTGTVLAHLRTHGPATYRQLAQALDLPIADVVDAVRALQEHRHVESAGAAGWKHRTRGTAA